MADATGLASPVIVAGNFVVDHGVINHVRVPTYDLLEKDIALIEDASVTLGLVVSAGRKLERNPGAVASSDDDIEAFQHPKRVAKRVPNPHMIELESVPGLGTIGVSDPCCVASAVWE
jgi:hypothetical protein